MKAGLEQIALQAGFLRLGTYFSSFVFTVLKAGLVVVRVTLPGFLPRRRMTMAEPFQRWRWSVAFSSSLVMSPLVTATMSCVGATPFAVYSMDADVNE